MQPRVQVVLQCGPYNRGMDGDTSHTNAAWLSLDEAVNAAPAGYGHPDGPDAAGPGHRTDAAATGGPGYEPDAALPPDAGPQPPPGAEPPPNLGPPPERLDWRKPR